MNPQQDSCEDQDTENPPAMSKQVNTQNAQPSSNQEVLPPKKDFRTSWRRCLELVFAGIVALFTAILGYVSCQQAKIMQFQADTMESSQRAYVIVKIGLKELERFEEGNIAHVEGVFENMGQTPVYNGTWMSGINVLEDPMNGEFPYPQCEEMFKSPDAGQWSFGKITYPAKDRNVVFTKDEIESIKNGKKAVYFNGRFCYRDIFKKIRHTDFCMYWKWEGDKLGRSSYCQRGNNID